MHQHVADVFCSSLETATQTFQNSIKKNNNVLSSFLTRFVELVPQYYFSNLPPSESKDILQEVINHLSPVSTMKEEQKTNNDNKENEKFPQSPTEQRCIIQ